MATALVGGLVCFPVVILPLIIAILHKNKYIKSEAEKVIKAIEKTRQMKSIMKIFIIIWKKAIYSLTILILSLP